MNTNDIKANLREYYNQEAEHRDASGKQDWKLIQRELFLGYIANENKKTLLEIGAGSGQDSKFFMDSGLTVTAIDLSDKMVKICKEKSIDAYEMDFYHISTLDKKFDCVWAMNSLLHVPKPDLLQVLQGIDSVLNEDGLFYMGVYGGEDTDNNWVNDFSCVPRYFSYYAENTLKQLLSVIFEIVEFHQFNVNQHFEFQSIIMRKK